ATARSRPRTPSPRGLTTRAWVRSTRGCARVRGLATSASPTPRPWPRSGSAPSWRASCPRWSPPTRCTTRAPWPWSWGPAGGCSCACRAAATRTWIRCLATRTEPLADRLRATDDLKLVPYLMAGHPTLEKSTLIAKRLATSGAAALEIGIPFSDPLADGPVIQRAGQVALDHGMSVARALDLAADIGEEGG